jgi:hypothetical protein
MKAVQRLINSMWTLTYELVSETSIKVIDYTRDDDEGYEREWELPRLRVIEDDKRFIISAEIGGKTYTVTNPRFVFSYHRDQYAI